MTETALIDSNIWHYAYVVPKEREFIVVHNMARNCLEDLVRDTQVRIAITIYQAAEIIELLRKGNVDAKTRGEVFESFKSDKFLRKEIVFSDVEAAFQKSLRSSIHIYDYLVTLPLTGVVTKIYSADDHFQHPDFTDIAQVINPLYPWILREGRKPVKQT